MVVLRAERDGLPVLFAALVAEAEVQSPAARWQSTVPTECFPGPGVPP